MKMLSLRRRYQKERALARQRQKPDIPAIIVVESRPGSPVFPSTRDITSPRLVDGVFIEPDSPSPSPRHSMMTSRSPDTYSLDLSPSQLRRSSRRTSDISMLSANMADFSPRHSMVLEDEPAQLMTSMQNSQWGGKLFAPDCITRSLIHIPQTCSPRLPKKKKSSFFWGHLGHSDYICALCSYSLLVNAFPWMDGFSAVLILSFCSFVVHTLSIICIVYRLASTVKYS